MSFQYFDVKTDPLIAGVSDDLMQMLDMARGRSGMPYVLTSALRQPDQNAKLKGAVCDSAHLPDATGKCHAVDIACEDDNAVFCMIFGLMMAGFRRIGIYLTRCESNPSKFVPRHIHVDDDTSKPLDVMWFLLEQN